jgi:hypothetical protein
MKSMKDTDLISSTTLNMRSELLNIPINPAKIKSGHIEKDFQLQVMTYLRKRDWYCFKIPDVGLGTRLLDGYHITPE